MKSEKREIDLKERLEVIGQMEVLDMHTHLVSLSEEETEDERGACSSKNRGDCFLHRSGEHPRNGNLRRNFGNGRKFWRVLAFIPGMPVGACWPES